MIERAKTDIFKRIDTESSAMEGLSGGVAIAGTPTTLVMLRMGLNSFDESKIEGEILRNSEVAEFVRRFKQMNPEEIYRKYGEVVKGREDLILAGGVILLCIMDIASLDNVIVSTKGLRFGAIKKYIKEKHS
jgi:exopolyphosphatase / guanosine-5'-triphosphate,3'-diphosphate pyrophosphatase